MRWRWAGAAEQNLAQLAWDSVLQGTSFLFSWPAARKSLDLAAILGELCREVSTGTHEAAVLDWGRGFLWDPPKLSVKSTAGLVDLIRLLTRAQH
jgi:hypothetical protein